MNYLSNTVEGNNRKQVRFVSPLMNHRHLSRLSPPPTPLLSPVLTPPQSPPLNRSLKDKNNSVRHQHLILSRSLTNSPQRVKHKEEQSSQQHSMLRFVQNLIKHSNSSDSLILPKIKAKTKCSKLASKQTLPTSWSLNSISSSSSNSPIYQLIWREERQRSFDELNKKLGNSSSSHPPIAISHPRRCRFCSEGGVLGHNSVGGVGGPSISNSSQSSSSSLRFNTNTTFHGSALCGCGVNICCCHEPAVKETKNKKERRRPLCHLHKPLEHQKFSSLFQSSQKRIFCWPPPNFTGQVILPKQHLPNSYTFPPPTTTIMNASPSHQQQQQQAYNELEDFDEDFVPRSSNPALKNSRNSMEGHIEERLQIRRMSLKEFSGLDLLEEQANQKAACNMTLHPWKTGHQLTLGSLIDKFSNRRRSSSSGGTKLESGIHHSLSEDGYNSFDRVLDGINNAIRETKAAENNEHSTITMSLSNRNEDKNGSQNAHHLEKQYSTSTGRNTFGQTLQRLTNIRNHLNSTLQSVPNASPRKAAASEPDCEKLVLLNECKMLVLACKDMVRNINSSPPTSDTSLQTSSDCHHLVQMVVDSAERAIDSIEMLIRKSNSIFQAQQLTSNADQLLKALAETVREVEKCQKPVKSSEQSKQLTRSSNILTANLISFTELIRNI